MPENGNFVTNISEKITPEGAKKSRKVEVGDIILSNSMSFGKPYIMGVDGYIHDGWFVIREFEKYFDKEYLCQLLVSPFVQNQYKKLAAGGVVLNISSDLVNSVKAPIISIAEQKKIAEFLSLVDKRIDKQRQLVENLKKYKRGLLSAIFERKIQFSNNEIWLEKKLKEVCNGFDNQRKPISAELREKGQIPYYGANGIQDYVKDYIFDGEYVLLAEDGGHFDEFSTMPIAQFINGKAWVNNHAHILQGKDTYNTKFIYYALVHKDIRKYINGTSRAKLNQEDMWDIQIIVPSFKLQIEIVEYFSKFDKIIKIHENCLKNLEYLKKGFLQQMFI